MSVPGRHLSIIDNNPKIEPHEVLSCQRIQRLKRLRNLRDILQHWGQAHGTQRPTLARLMPIVTASLFWLMP